MSGHLEFLFRSAAVAVFAMFGGVWFAPALAAGLPRIASMNVCTDQLLIPLADPEQILGLSRFSRDAWQSWAADDARRYPTLSGGAEDVLVLAPDIVVASSFDKRSTRELLKEQGLHLAEFAVPRNLDEVKAQIRRMGEIAFQKVQPANLVLHYAIAWIHRCRTTQRGERRVVIAVRLLRHRLEEVCAREVWIELEGFAIVGKGAALVAGLKPRIAAIVECVPHPVLWTQV